LNIAWRTVTPVELEPLFLDFGDVLPDSSHIATVRVIQRAAGSPEKPCRIMRFESAASPELFFQPDVVLEQGVGTLQIELRTGPAVGAKDGFIRAVLEGCWTDALRLPVRWRVRDVIEGTPARLLLGVGLAGHEVKGNVVVSSHGEGELRIDDARMTEELDWVTAASRPTSNDRVWIVDLSAKLPSTAGAHAGELMIECSAPETRTLRVPVSAHVRSVESDEQAGPSSVPHQSRAVSTDPGDPGPAAASPIMRREP
jgi:hypothetical protein